VKEFWEKVRAAILVFLLPLIKPYIATTVKRSIVSMWNAISEKDANVALYAALSLKGISKDALMVYVKGTVNEYDDLLVQGIIEGCEAFLSGSAETIRNEVTGSAVAAKRLYNVVPLGFSEIK
jgi:hypothetical protein